MVHHVLCEFVFIFLRALPAGKAVVTSDHDWIAIVGSGYIGLEFSDVYTALGSEVGPV